MQESFLHYIWQMQYFDKTDLITTSGERVAVFHTGTLNSDAGPDFLNARLRIGDLDWVGSVEIHLQSSDWLYHHHDRDPAYDNVILHVVWKLDKDIKRTDASSLPTLELRGRVDQSLIGKYRQLINSSFSIPCRRSLPHVEKFRMVGMLERAGVRRLERRAIEVLDLFDRNENDWEETCYQLLARSFGFKVNTEPFFDLARSLPLKLLLRQADHPEHVEALLFGQAGFLTAPKGDDHYLRLRQEHKLLARKFSLNEMMMSRAQWRFLRLRPANFPSLRLAQLAAILTQRQNFFSQILQIDNASDLFKLLTVMPSDYWLGHYQFSRTSKGKVHELGKSSMEMIIINAVTPLWVAYGKRMEEQTMVDRALRVLQQLQAEQNKITRIWCDLGVSASNAFESQALLELFNNFCAEKRCLDCSIGASLVRPN